MRDAVSCRAAVVQGAMHFQHLFRGNAFLSILNEDKSHARARACVYVCVRA